VDEARTIRYLIDALDDEVMAEAAIEEK